MKTNVLALQALLPREMAMLEAEYDVLKLWEGPNPEAVLQAHGPEIRAVVSAYNAVGVSGRMMEALPNLEIITQFGAGFDNIDLITAQARGITVTNTPDVLTDDTADIALMLMLNCARRGVEADMYVRVGRWPTAPFPLSTSITGKTVGIFGLGKIGTAIAFRAAAFGTTVCYHSRSAKPGVPYTYYDSLSSLAEASDFLILACAGGPATHGVVNSTILEKLGPKGYIINIARGSVIVEEELLIALKNKTIAGAGLDVYAQEPQVSPEYFTMDNVVLSPHVGSATLETRSKMGQLVLENLRAHFGGKPVLTPVRYAA